MKFKIKLDDNNYFEHILKILQAIPPFDALRDRELEVYSRLLYYYNELVGKSKGDFEALNKKLFGYEIRRKIETDIGISDSTLRNNLSTLRGKGIIEKKSLKQQYIVSYGSNIEFVFF
jgi:hypothetical protein